MKSSYNQNDLSCNEVGMQIKYASESFFKKLLTEFPEYNSREMIELMLGNFSSISARHILQWRREQEYKTIQIEHGKVKLNETSLL